MCKSTICNTCLRSKDIYNFIYKGGKISKEGMEWLGFIYYRMAFTSGELLEMPKWFIGLIRKRSLLLQSFAGAVGTGLKSFNIVATGTCMLRVWKSVY